MLESSKWIEQSKILTNSYKRKRRLQMMKMNNLMHVNKVVKNLKNIEKRETRFHGREIRFYRKENRLWKGCSFAIGRKNASKFFGSGSSGAVLRDLLKKHGFTLATVVTAAGITIGVIAKILADGASAAANGIKTVGKKVGDGSKELGKKIGSILPGLVGAIASFVFRAAGQAITFLGKNAWLLILFVAAFLIEKSPRSGENKISYLLAQMTKPTKTSAPIPTSALFM